MNKSKFQVVKTINEMRTVAESLRRKKCIIRLIPTMGALHEGHASLIRAAQKLIHHKMKIVVSIFVNPMQFNNQEDLRKYPSTLESDLDLCDKLDVDFVFTPSCQEIYPEGTNSQQLCHVEPSLKYSQDMEGASRPGHFSGMLTVVNKLFNIVQPHQAFFGEKDYQQLMLIKKMTLDLNMPVIVSGVETLRDKDFLPFSSRNIRLGKEERILSSKMIERLMKGMVDIIKCSQLVSEIDQDTLELAKFVGKVLAPLKLIDCESIKWHLDYIEARCEQHFEPLKRFAKSRAFNCESDCLNNQVGKTIMPVRILCSIVVDKVKLLDNIKTNMIQDVY